MPFEIPIRRREDWRMAVHVYLADSRKEAMAHARLKAGRYQREYFEQTIGLPAVFDGPADKIIDEMVDRGAWCVGTPDDLIAHIERLDEESGGFGGLLITATEWGTREQVLHSYELIARYVKPHFQGSLTNLQAAPAVLRQAGSAHEPARAGHREGQTGILHA